MSCPRSVSRSGFASMNSRNSPMSSLVSPAARRSSRSCSTAVSRRSSNATEAAQSTEPLLPDRTGPRHRSSASRSAVAACVPCPAAVASLACLSPSVNRLRSTCSSVVSPRYPGPSVTIRFRPSGMRCRNSATALRTWWAAVAGGLSSQAASTSRKTGSTRRGSNNRVTSTLSCTGPPTRTRSGPSQHSNESRMRNRTPCSASFSPMTRVPPTSPALPALAAPSHQPTSAGGKTTCLAGAALAAHHVRIGNASCVVSRSGALTGSAADR